jgi:hypothetical protein
LWSGAYAQAVKVYGQTSTKGKPLSDVLIVVFENDSFYKKINTDRKGKYRFRVEDKAYTILYYKPGYAPQQVRIVNKLDADVQLIPFNMDMDSSEGSPDTVMARSGLLDIANPHMAVTYISYLYRYERKHIGRRKDTSARTLSHILIERALDEQRRFENYRRSDTLIQGSNSKDKLVTIAIGPHKYEMQTSQKGEKRYFKNDKPVTEMTYLFETTRRYEGVLKNKKDVRDFKQYDPHRNIGKHRH